MVAQPMTAPAKYRGVYHDKRAGRFYAHIHVKGKRKYLGSYLTPEEAARAYDRAVLTVRDQPTALNFPAETEEKPTHRPTPNRLMEQISMPADRSYSFHQAGDGVPAFETQLQAAMSAMGTTSRSETLRQAAMIGLDALLNPAPATEAEPDAAMTLPQPTIRNLAMLGSLLVAIKRMPQVAGALTETVDAIIDAVGRDMDVLSAYLDA